MISVQALNPAVIGIHTAILRKVYILYVQLILYMYIFHFEPRTLQ